MNLYLEKGVRWEEFDPGVPRVYVANHVGFWDGLVLNFILGRYRRQPRYCMVGEPQVRKHPFLRRAGAFSIDRDHSRSALESLHYAVALLHTQPPPALVVFPQGKLVHPDVRPLGFESGIVRLLRMAPPGTEVVPVALRYELTTEQYPEAFVRWGRAREAGEMTSRGGHRRVEALLAAHCDELRSAALAARPGERSLLEGIRSVHEWRMMRLPWPAGSWRRSLGRVASLIRTTVPRQTA